MGGPILHPRRTADHPGDVRVEDARDALRELAEEPRRFDAIVVDITDTVLQPSDVQNLRLGPLGVPGGPW